MLLLAMINLLTTLFKQLKLVLAEKQKRLGVYIKLVGALIEKQLN
jgi:hypothetical protein